MNFRKLVLREMSGERVEDEMGVVFIGILYHRLQSFATAVTASPTSLQKLQS